MTETTEAPGEGTASAAPAKKRGGLNSMLLADLKAMANGMGIAGAGGMRKAQLIEAIKGAQTQQAGGRSGNGEAPQRDDRSGQQSGQQSGQKAGGPSTAERSGDQEVEEKAPRRRQRDRSQPQDQPKQDQPKAERPKQDQPKQDQPKQDQPRAERPKQDQPKQDQPKQDQPRAERPKQDQPKQDQPKRDEAKQDEGRPDPSHQQDQDDDGDGEGGGRRNRRRRGRDRNSRTGRGEPDTEVREDDVLVPAAGILDVLDNYAFVRTSGYLAGADDVYLSLSLVRKYGLRRGDAVAGQVRQPREGERREKFNPMVRVDTVNGSDPEQSKNRPEFEDQTPVHPAERLRLETGSDDVTGRMVDLVAPLGKGQRGLILSPERAGRTALLQALAHSITTNHPECHLMVVLVDERPEEVTDFQRSIKGEVVSCTFDRPAADHTNLAELALERAKRLVELGHDVVVLLDGLTRLGRAYNHSATGGGRVLPGGIDAGALFGPKRLLGAARNIEDGGSLTMLATARVESASAVDQMVLDELSGTENWELRLRRELAEKRHFPAVDAAASGTRREDQLIGSEELQILWKLRRTLAELDVDQAWNRLADQIGGSQNNIGLLTEVQRTGSPRA